MKKFLAFMTVLGLFVSCNDDDTVVTTPDPDPIVFTNGSANFSNYVAIGNSLTAGFSDAALFVDGQTASFPNMLAQNFALVGGGDFTIPFMADNLGGATFGGQPVLGNRLFLAFTAAGPAPTPVSGTGTTEITNVLSGPFNNMGVPGATSFQLLAPGFGNLAGVPVQQANPYFARFASAPDATVIGDALAQSPTFFSLWIGNNDILGYATSGGSGADHNVTGNTDPATYGGGDITNNNVFASVYSGIVQQLVASGAQGVVANIPNVTDIPFFTTVPHNPVPLDAQTAALLNGAYTDYNQAMLAFSTNQNPLGMPLITPEEAQRRMISFEAGASNAVVILDEDLTDLTMVSSALLNLRQATAEDLLVLTSSSFIGSLANPNDPTSANGLAVPLADQWVLTPEEQEAVSVALTSYNQTIESVAAANGLAFVNANALLSDLNANGLTLADGSVVTSVFATGGGFSLDGVHPSPRGYAILANAFTDAINETYGSNLPDVNPLDFTGLYID